MSMKAEKVRVEFERPGVSAFDDPLAQLDAVATADYIRRGDLDTAEVMEATIARAERLQPSLNFLVSTDFDRARKAAAGAKRAGPFAGVPMLVKDLSDAIGFTTGHGARFAQGGPKATSQLPFVDAMEVAGFTLFGKSGAPEFGMMPTTESNATGPARNPWNPAFSTGGSSGGAAAAVAAGVIPVAHATDGGGSIRIPASCCGLFGLKPARQRTVLAEVPDESPIQIAVGLCVSRTVRDTATFLDVVERKGSDAMLPPVGLVTAPLGRRLKVGLLLTGFGGQIPHPEVTAAIEQTAALVETLGHDVEPAVWPFGQEFFTAFMKMAGSGLAHTVRELEESLGRTLDEQLVEPYTLALAELHGRDPAAAAAAIEDVARYSRVFTEWLNGYDVVLSPVLSDPPTPIGHFAPGLPYELMQERLDRYIAFTPPHNAAGVASMSVPLSLTSEGLPVGSQFAAGAGGERLLLELAYQLEEASPWTCR
ncbi:amidase [Sphingomonas sp. CL5.1]|uniref:amidase n=1 Tax=Sphingomonas sp. CL5.1 TaxID=2653203 RepID=UPI001C2E3BFD|nr:amidase [Sphingomonas sp. CL5.1]